MSRFAAARPAISATRLPLRAITALVLTSFVMLTGCDTGPVRDIGDVADIAEILNSDAGGDVRDLTVTRIVGSGPDGGPDGGFEIKFTVVNLAGDGVLWVRPKLSTSEGEYTRRQALRFARGERKVLTYRFLEPSDAATNIDSSVRLIPEYRPPEASPR